MSKHTPLIELQSARSAYNSAVQCCPHWEYGDPASDRDHECCCELDDAQRRLSRAKRAVAKAEGQS